MEIIRNGLTGPYAALLVVLDTKPEPGHVQTHHLKTVVALVWIKG